MKKNSRSPYWGTISMQADQNGAVESSPINPMTQVTSPLENIEVVSVDF